MKKILLVTLCFLCAGLFKSIAQNVKQVKLTDFDMQSSSQVSGDGSQISDPDFRSGAYWFPVKVPCTVLTGLVANKVYPDPYQGLNNMLIPDASDQFNKEYNLGQYSHIAGEPNPWKKPYWYRTTFKIPVADKGKIFQLIFKGINYRAAVWVNGHQIADSTQMAGMFAEYNLDITNAVRPGADNVVAVKIYPLDYPGLPAKEQLAALGPFYENGGPTGDIGKNVTMLCSVGWDWIPPVRDRNMGIWQPVFLRTTGAVTIGHTKIITSLNLPDTTKAKIGLSVQLDNHTNKPVRGKLKVIIKPENFAGLPIEFTQDYAVSANSYNQISEGPETIGKLLIRNPKLWWPNNYGRANLYRIRMQFTDNKGLSDDTTFVFGIRTVSSKASVVNNYVRREFYVNGKRVHLNGGAWVPDMMLNRDSARYDYEMHLCRNANNNLVRIWGGGVTPGDPFWEAADKYGQMVWSDFWITGDTQGEFKGSPDYPLESNVFIKNVISTIYRVRNHPSLLVWTGGNEGHARKELYDAMRKNIIDLDGTRPFIPSSSGHAKLPVGWNGAWPDDKPTGVYSGGPYEWKDPKDYYKLADLQQDWVFKDETGLPSQPPFATLSKIIPNLTWDKSLPYPLNNSWGYHDAATGAGRYDKYYQEMVTRYGQPTGLKEFSDKMQLMNSVGYKGIFEAAGHKLTETGGVMLWKLNAAFPSVIWQIYDWYLEPNAGYYAMQNALQPVHIQFNPADSSVEVINRRHFATGRLSPQASVYNVDGKLIRLLEMSNIGLPDEGVVKTIKLKTILAGINEAAFIVLNLKDIAGKTVSHNVYWTSPGNDFSAFNKMKSVHLDAGIIKTIKGVKENSYTIQLTNNTAHMAFFVNPQLMSKSAEIMPSYWSANYFTLAPRETITLTVTAPVAKLGTSAPNILVGGWNVDQQLLNTSLFSK